MALTSEQRKVLRTIIRVGKQKGATPMERKAAVETGLVETNLRNLSYGTGTSKGWRQETRSSYPSVNRLNLPASVGRFYDEVAAVRGKYGSAGQLAQAVQRSAYPGRYQQRSGEADALLRGTPTGTTGVSRAVAPTSDSRQEIALSLLGMGGLTGGYGGGGDDPLTSALLQAAKGRQGGAAVPSGPQPTGQDIHAVVARAKAIDHEHLPYQWGGGHGSTPAGPGVPLDCSGAVSRLLGIKPRVSGDYAKFGKPGRGKSLTIYANGRHVLMEINGHFWGTSGTNPGGGAGWIPRSAISPDYLKGFVARHPAGF